MPASATGLKGVVNLSGNTILTASGTSGIGFELAAQLSGRGNTVIVTGRGPATLDAATITA